MRMMFGFLALMGLLVIGLVFYIIFLTTFGEGSIKSFDDLFTKFLGNEEENDNGNGLREESINVFDSLVSDYERCFNINKDCICMERFPRFPSTYYLDYDTLGMKINLLDKEKEIVKEVELRKKVTCFSKIGKTLSKEDYWNGFEIDFKDNNKIKINTPQGNEWKISTDHPALIKHKSGEVCFVLDKDLGGFFNFVTNKKQEKVEKLNQLPVCQNLNQKT